MHSESERLCTVQLCTYFKLSQVIVPLGLRGGDVLPHHRRPASHAREVPADPRGSISGVEDSRVPCPLGVRGHYTFNLRDPAKMLQGMLMVHVKTELSDETSLIRCEGKGRVIVNHIV